MTPVYRSLLIIVAAIGAAAVAAGVLIRHPFVL